ncbi:MAG TPA: hypothetical protein VH374_17880 [Polyangia bacterium]|jgi:hypothetical protein|nr:hypothetical protein [Polyangia bacterium]
MIDKIARWDGCLALALVLLATGSCQAPSVQVNLTISIPSAVRYDHLRLLRVLSATETKLVHEWDVGEMKSLSMHAAGLMLGRGTSDKLRLQAIQAMNVVAQSDDFNVDGSRQLVDGGPPVVTVDLIACASPFPDDQIGQCAPMDSPVADAGMDGSRDAFDAEADAEVWAPVPCVDNLDASARPLPSPLPTPPAGCEMYCALMTQNCPESYGSPDRCNLACATLDWDTGAQSGDTLECRTAWARQAAVSSNDCPNAEVFGLGYCGDVCGVYCRTGTKLCPSYFPEFNDCLKRCSDQREADMQMYPARSFGDDYIICRFGHILDILVDPGLCQFLAPNTCTDECFGLPFSADSK